MAEIEVDWLLIDRKDVIGLNYDQVDHNKRD